MNPDTLQSVTFYAVPALGFAALAFAYWKSKKVSAADTGTDRMREIAEAIQDGAMAFLRRELAQSHVWDLLRSHLVK